MARPEATSLVESIAHLARSHRLRKVGIDWLWEAFLKQHTELDALERRSLFMTALKDWAASGGCRLPRRKQDWRQDAIPALPNWVQVLVPKVATVTPSPRESARARGWTPLMQFMANRASIPDLTTAVSLDNYIRTKALDTLPWVPAKERSVDIFGHGHEKKLERLAEQSGWFTAGGLSLATLRCFRVPRQPVHALFPNARPGGIIISENEAGFHSLCRAAAAGAGFSCVVCGDGSEVLRVAEFLQQQARALDLQELFYFGDVDYKGLEIATSLHKRLAVAGVLQLLPWIPGYAAVLAEVAGRPDGVRSSAHTAMIDWLPPELRAPADAVVFTRSHRAQEAFGWTQMARLWNLPVHFGDTSAAAGHNEHAERIQGRRQDRS